MSRKNILISFILLLLCFCFNVKTFASAGFFVPSGFEIETVSAQEINIQYVVVGQKVEVIMLDDFIYSNKVVIPKESVIQGSIVSYSRVESNEQKPFVLVKFSTIRTPYNNIIPINASIKTDDLSGTLFLNEDNVLIKPNEKINIVFNQPITLNTH